MGVGPGLLVALVVIVIYKSNFPSAEDYGREMDTGGCKVHLKGTWQPVQCGVRTRKRPFVTSSVPKEAPCQRCPELSATSHGQLTLTSRLLPSKYSLS